MKKISIHWQDFISRPVTEITVPEDATPEQINEAIEAAINEADGSGGLCHYCTNEVGELNGSDSHYAYDEDGNVIYDDTYAGRLEKQITALQAELKVLKGQ